MGLVFGKQSRHKRVYYRFASSVADGEHEHAPKQAFISGILRADRVARHHRIVNRSGRQRDHCGQEVHDKSKDHQLAVADFVGDQSTEENDDSKSSQTASSNVSKITLCEAELGAPIS